MKKILAITLILITSFGLMAQTFTYNGAPDAIPDADLANPLCTDIVVPAGTTADLDHIEVAIDHTWVGDLNITLKSPAAVAPGINIRLRSGFGSSTNLASGFPILFGDSFVAPIANIGESPAACGDNDVQGDPGAPCTDTEFLTTDALSTMAGTAVGPWTLCVGDGAGGDTGTLRSWSIVGNGSLPVELKSLSID